MKMIFNYDPNKTHFHNKGFALSLVLRVRFFGTRKWPIELGLVKLDAYNTTGSHIAYNLFPFVEGLVAQRIRHLTTNHGIPGSNPGGVDFFFFTKKRYVEGLLISGYSTLIARMSL